MSDSIATPKTDPEGHQAIVRTIGRSVQRRVTSLPWLSRAAAVGLCVLSLALIASFVTALGQHGLTLFVSNPPLVQVVLVLSYLVALFAAGTAIGAVLAWRHRYWSRTARIHQTVLAILGIAFVWQLSALGFLP